MDQGPAQPEAQDQADGPVVNQGLPERDASKPSPPKKKALMPPPLFKRAVEPLRTHAEPDVAAIAHTGRSLCNLLLRLHHGFYLAANEQPLIGTPPCLFMRT